MASLARSEAQSNTRKLILSCRSREFVDFTHQSTRVSASMSWSRSSQRGSPAWQVEPVTRFLVGSGCLRRKVSEHMPPRLLIHLCLEGVHLFQRNRHRVDDAAHLNQLLPVGAFAGEARDLPRRARIAAGH